MRGPLEPFGPQAEDDLMIFRQLLSLDGARCSYLVEDPGSRTVVLVDPVPSAAAEAA